MTYFIAALVGQLMTDGIRIDTSDGLQEKWRLRGLAMGRVVSFSFRCPGAQSVTLAGDFNNWDVSAHPMVYDGPLDSWTVALPLEPGRYEYKFFVDGRVWWNDPSAPKVPNVWGSENSYLDVE